MKRFALAALLTMSAAHADIRPEIGLGFTQFEHAGNGIWWQEEFDHKLTLQSPSIELGMTGDIKPWLGWRAGYKYLGRVKSDALALSIDPVYDQYRADKSPKDYKPSGHLGRWEGDGYVHGVYLSLTPSYRINDNVNVVLEAGAYVYKSTWNMHVTEWQPCLECGLQNIFVSHRAHWKADAFYGAGVKFKNSSLMFNAYPSDSGGDDFPAVYGNRAMTITYRQGF